MNNEDAKAKVLRRQAERLAVLRAAFDASDGGQRLYIIDPEWVAEHTKIDVDEVHDAVRYLDGEGLLKLTTLGGGFEVTHEGRLEVERTLLEPEEGTEHFTPSVIQVFNNMSTTNNTTNNTTTTVHGNMGANVVGNNNTTTTTQTVTTSVVQNEARAKVAELRRLAAELPAPQRDEADEILVEWDDALQSNDKSIIKRLPREGRRLSDLFTFANVAAGVQALPALVELLTKFLGS